MTLSSSIARMKARRRGERPTPPETLLRMAENESAKRTIGQLVNARYVTVDGWETEDHGEFRAGLYRGRRYR